MQIAAAILFFYVFGLAAFILTVYVIVVCYRFFHDVKKPK